MNCEQVRELLSAYLDNMFASEERQSIATHLQSCMECSSLLLDYRRFDVLLSQLPRIEPRASLRDRVFSSKEYQELTGTCGGNGSIDVPPCPSMPRRLDNLNHPHLISIPGGKYSSVSAHPPSSPSPRRKSPRNPTGMQTPGILVVTLLLLMLGIGSIISWHLWQKHEQNNQGSTASTILTQHQQDPLPAGLRFIFLRDGALWSAPSDGSANITRLTPTNTTVSNDWVVRPTYPGRSAGNMLAYIDLKQGLLHVVHSDGQQDIAIPQPLLKPGILPATVWDTETGIAILTSLAWSPDGSMLAFVADADGSRNLQVFIYFTNTGKVQAIHLPVVGRATQPHWSPDSVRLAFKFTANGQVDIIDYNVQNQGLLTLKNTVVNTTTNPDDTVLDLDWGSSKNIPTITWSVGTPGHLHSIWVQQVGIEELTPRRPLLQGSYMQAIYHQTSVRGQGSWLVTGDNNGIPGDLQIINIATGHLGSTEGKQISKATWSPDGTFITYFDRIANGVGTLHILNTNTGSDNLIATNVISEPSPEWSADSQNLTYTTGMHIMVVNIHNLLVAQALVIQGPVTTLCWSPTSSSQLIVTLDDISQGIYLVDIRQNTTIRINNKSMRGPIYWTQIP